jgi:prepilin-type N-terminal cleavage/methylation domain-containing protein
MIGRGNQDGFSLIEVLVAFVIVSLGLVSLYAALGLHFKSTGRAALHQTVLTFAQSHLDTIVQPGPLDLSATSGVYPNGTPWRLRTVRLAGGDSAQSMRSAPVTIVLEAFDRSGNVIVRLKTIKLVPATP